ncbi:uncharacterized protein BDR25DRAFT_301519 [Lindgomyces ingoldianus]|uniref:Uncharacterized protein n=1 Tax=Lindgomyces ingoldianus TaxID=673940 RepID=A0ACB6R9H3_9PLEO|nr:uncharacterized protein BDR25DRAFT_301519 [Lindgomyces ingoldianus]KAF2474980.1 hypothetical protein BDR25DRAFT_301519 [Lindgomyces ingoldianus]
MTMEEPELTPEERLSLKLDSVACAAAESFIDAYYETLKTNRNGIGAFYCPRAVAPDGVATPSIVWNGETYEDGDALQHFFQGVTYTHFQIEDLDANTLNPTFLPANDIQGGSCNASNDLERRMSFIVVVTGSVRLEEQLKGPLREFAESFVLVPNPAKLALSPGQTSKHIPFEGGWDKQWLIQTQNFTFTEWAQDELGDFVRDAPTQPVSGKAGGGGKPVFGRNRGPFNAFAAAGLLGKGKGKALA